MTRPTLILTRSDISGLFSFTDYVDAVEHGFRLLATSKVDAPPPLHVKSSTGGLHGKAAAAEIDGASYVAVKVNANFPDNPSAFGLPTIQGALLLFDGERGSLLAIMDSIAITIARTGAATAIAARLLANPDARTATICGCGEQGRVQLAALLHALPIQKVFAFDADSAAVGRYADRMRGEHGISVEPVGDLAAAALASDVIVTCTSARSPLLGVDDVRPGTFVAAIGADAPDKHEIAPVLMARARVITDVTDQCAVMGDLHHALAGGAMQRGDVCAELGDVVTGRKTGRQSRDDIVIFDSTGTGVQDLVAAAGIYRRAARRGVGLGCALA